MRDALGGVIWQAWVEVALGSTRRFSGSNAEGFDMPPDGADHDRGSAAPPGGHLVPLRGGVAAAPAGRVTLVGAGPGDPELLTLKAVRVLQRADVVVHDRLVSAEVLDFAPKHARRLYVGKRKARHALPQEDINALLVGLARDGLEVVRLKGGDPFMFGRGGEELEACRAAGVACEVVPGISAAMAAAASAGVPLTYRGSAQAVTFVTGHAAPDADGGWRAPELDWADLATANRTVVVYMGLSTAAVIAGRLIAAGRSGSTPALAVERASQPLERRIRTTLRELGAATAGLDGPVVLIIGEAAAMGVALEPPGLGSGERPARAAT